MPRPPRQRLARARPLAEPSVDPVVERAEQLAQDWAVSLILARPLEGAAGVPLEEIAREGPALCAQMLRALQSDVELDRLTGGGAPSGREHSAPALRLAAIAGAHDAPAAIDAVEALRGVLWEALVEEIRWPLAERSAARALAELSDRLAYVCARALAVSLADRLAPAAGGGVEEQSTHRASGGGGDRGSAGAGPSPARAVIVDEREHARSDSPAAGSRIASASEAGGPSVAAQSVPDAAATAFERPLSWDKSPPVPPAARGAEIEIRDERREEGPAAWIGAIGAQLERYRQDGVPFAVLLVEPVEMDRLRRAETPLELADLSDRLAHALAAAWPDALTRQREGRYWLLARAVTRHGASELAERLQQAVAASVLQHGAPLELAIGIALCPEDGLQAAALASHADVGMYAARSAARRIGTRRGAPVDEPA